MRPRWGVALALAAAGCWSGPTAHGDGGPGVVVTPGDASGQYQAPAIGLGAFAPERPPNGSHERGSTSTPGRSHDDARTGDSSLPPLPTWCPNRTCTSEEQPNPEGPPLPLPGGNGYLCPLPQNQGLCPAPPPAPPGAPPPSGGGPNPGVLAQQAAAQLRLPLPAPSRSPELHLGNGAPATLVNEHTWFWTRRADWHPYQQRVQAGPAWAEVTARPVQLSLTPGDGNPAVRCGGPGVPYSRIYGPHAASPSGCDIVYTRPSPSPVSAQAAITWQVTWRGGLDPAATEGGTLPPMTSRNQTSIVVVEVQTLRTR